MKSVMTTNIQSDSNSYKICNTVMNDDLLTLSLISDNAEKIKLRILVDDYYNYGLKKDSIVKNEIVQELQKKEAFILAYRSALKRLAIKDYSVHQMKESLRKKYEISEDELNELVKKLKENRLLNDSEYTKNKIIYLSNSSLSIKAIRQKLINDGIAKEIIDKYLIEDSNEELEKAKRKAEKYLLSIKGKSLNAKKQAILNKLLNDGFKTEDSKKAVAELDFSKDILLEDDLLKLERDKAYRKYSKKYEGYELKNKIYSFLVLKGFNYDAISEVINEMEF